MGRPHRILSRMAGLKTVHYILTLQTFTVAFTIHISYYMTVMALSHFPIKSSCPLLNVLVIFRQTECTKMKNFCKPWREKSWLFQYMATTTVQRIDRLLASKVRDECFQFRWNVATSFHQALKGAAKSNDLTTFLDKTGRDGMIAMYLLHLEQTDRIQNFTSRYNAMQTQKPWQSQQHNSDTPINKHHYNYFVRSFPACTTMSA